MTTLSPAGPSGIPGFSVGQNPGIFRDLLIECKGTYGPLGPSATALVGQNIITVRSHLKKHSGMQLMWIQAGDLRRIVIGVVNA